MQWRLPLGPGHGVRAEGAHANLPFSSSRLVQTGWVAEVGLAKHKALVEVSRERDVELLVGAPI